jgi:hypothetical protein
VKLSHFALVHQQQLVHLVAAGLQLRFFLLQLLAEHRYHLTQRLDLAALASTCATLHGVAPSQPLYPFGDHARQPHRSRCACRPTGHG